MPSYVELVNLFNDGKLGELLTREFNGKIGHTYPMKDSDFMVGFESEEKVPKVEEIARVVSKFYQDLGYEFVSGQLFSGDDCCSGMVHHDRDKPSWLGVVLTITTRYPISPGKNRAYMRATCQFV